MNAPWRTAHKVDIQAHLSALFPPAFVRPFPDAEIEIVYGAPDEKLTTSRWFSALHIEEIVGFVEVRVDRGDNIYVGASLRKGPAPEKMRARTENFLAASCGWAEYDAAGDAERIDRILKEKQLKPAIIVTTGMTPCLRQHLYFRIKGGITDPGKLKAVNTALRDLFDSDPVIDAIRIMRLGGSVNYPTEKEARARLRNRAGDGEDRAGAARVFDRRTACVASDSIAAARPVRLRQRQAAKQFRFPAGRVLEQGQQPRVRQPRVLGSGHLPQRAFRKGHRRVPHLVARPRPGS